MVYNTTSFIPQGVANTSTLDIQNAQFNYLVDSIQLPTKSFTTLQGNWTKAVSGLNCTTAGVCSYSGVCSDISSKFLPLYVNFGAATYSIPAQSYLVDDFSSMKCNIKITKGTGNSAVFGLPWFKTYYTAFDGVNNAVGFGLTTGSFGSII